MIDLQSKDAAEGRKIMGISRLVADPAPSPHPSPRRGEGDEWYSSPCYEGVHPSFYLAPCGEAGRRPGEGAAGNHPMPASRGRARSARCLNDSSRFRQHSLGITLVALAAIVPASRAAEPRAPRPATDTPASKLVFEIKCAPALHTRPLDARVYVMLGSDESAVEPRNGPNWFRPEPFFGLDVQGWKPGEPLDFGAKADGFPAPLNELKAGRYAIQAVVRLNRDTNRIGNGEGNLYGPVVRATLDPKAGGKIALAVDHVVPPRKFVETDRVKLVEIDSPMLSAFHHRPIKHRAAVILPRPLTGDSDKTKLPTIYIIPGFGGDHFMASRITSSPRANYGEDFIRVILDPDFGTGHHVFADSANNGPRGKALLEELIPHIERAYPAIADPGARLLNGHSSGGWSSLWLQVTYPDFFAGTWSTSPDPVDFRDFQRINIYAAGENMFKDRDGNRRPIARMGGSPAMFYDPFSKMDDVIGWGGQLGSFEAVFSPMGAGGRPRRLWNRPTGEIDPEVAKAWEAYDIRLVLERNWPALGPKLKGKLHIITGGMDTFYLEGAVGRLKESLAKLESDAVVEIVHGKDHGSVLSSELAHRIDREMHEAVSSFLPARTAAGN
jgi:Putative esterase